jgi:hypothetical protein
VARPQHNYKKRGRRSVLALVLATAGLFVAQGVAAATVELTRPPALTRVPELTSLGKLMTVPELSVPQLVLIPELVPPAELGMLTRSVTVVAGDMVTPDNDLADALSELADSVKAK